MIVAVLLLGWLIIAVHTMSEPPMLTERALITASNLNVRYPLGTRLFPSEPDHGLLGDPGRGIHLRTPTPLKLAYCGPVRLPLHHRLL